MKYSVLFPSPKIEILPHEAQASNPSNHGLAKTSPLQKVEKNPLLKLEFLTIVVVTKVHPSVPPLLNYLIYF